MSKYKGTKKNVTLFVDDQLYDEAKAMGLPISKLLEETLGDQIENPSMSKEEMDMRRKLRQQKQLLFQRDLLLDEIKDIEDQLKDLGMEIQEHEKLAERAKLSEDRGKIMRSLNQFLEAIDYNAEIAWNHTTIQGWLKQLSVIDKEEWDMEKFVKHLERLMKLKRIERG